VKQCPTCEIELAPVSYEGFRIFHCPKCGGHLLSLDRLESIKRAPKRSQEQLKEEARAEFAGDDDAARRCPRCHRPMEREPADIPGVRVYLDRCPSCRLAWLDSGELAVLQLAYEATREFRSAEDLRRRVRELEASPERKAQFEEDLARLPDASDPMSEAIAEGAGLLLHSLLRGLRP
jgi:Zn-finger nucleic acid-binding protein